MLPGQAPGYIDDFTLANSSMPYEDPANSHAAYNSYPEPSPYLAGSTFHVGSHRTAMSGPFANGTSTPPSFINPSLVGAPSYSYGSSPAYSSAPPSHINPVASTSSLDVQRMHVQAEQRRQLEEMHRQQLAASAPTVSASASGPVAQPRSAAPLNPTLQKVAQVAPTRPSPPPVASTSSAPPAPAPILPETPWERVLPTLRPNLVASRIQKSPTSTASKLANLLSAFQILIPPAPVDTVSTWGDLSEVPANGRLEVLVALEREGNEAFWKAWVKEKEGMSVFATWFKGASQPFLSSSKVKGKGNDLVSSLRPMLKILKKLPLTFEHLVIHPFGASVRKISETDKITDPEIKKLASALYKSFKKLQAERGAPPTTIKAEAGAKRKAEDAEGAKKKVKTVTVAKPVAMKPKPPASALGAALKGVALPSFTKVKKEASAGGLAGALSGLGAIKTVNAASSSSAGRAGSPSITSGRATGSASPAPSTPLPSNAVESTTSSKPAVKKGLLVRGKRPAGPKKKVVWASEDKLEAIKFIEKAIYDDDPSHSGEHGFDNVREMEEQEGQTLSMRLEDEMEVEVDWYPPITVVTPMPFNDIYASPASELEVLREARVPEAVLDPYDPPQTPTESASAYLSVNPLPSDLVDAPKVMALSTDLENDVSVGRAIADAQASLAPRGTLAASDQLSSILLQLNPSAPSPAPISVDQAALEALQRTLQQAGGFPSGGGSFGAAPTSTVPYGSYAAQSGTSEFPPVNSGWGAPVVSPNPWETGNGARAGANAAPGGAGAVRAARSMVIRGKKSKQKKCMFFERKSGCDWGEKCRNLHDRGDGMDIRDA